jgi:glycosyltransferase involved in cell wall biosynthesis
MARMSDTSPSEHRAALILEPEWDGHQREWLEHLVALAAERPDYRVWFVVAASSRDTIADRIPPTLRDRLRLLVLTPGEQRLCTMRPLIVAAFARLYVMRRYLRMTDADQGHFLAIDLLSLPLALGFGFGKRSVSGILFRPSVHYRTISPYQRSWGERLRDLRKEVLYRLMLRNRAVAAVLTLDPYFAAYTAKHYRNGHKVVPLPDPAHPATRRRADEISITAPLERHRTVFALFGFIAERKGALVLLDALARLPSDLAAKTAVVIAGRIENRIRTRIDRARRRLQRERPSLQLVVEDRWLSPAELTGLVERCDVVVAPYQRFVGSSGVILWAAAAGKPVLTQDFGLIGRLVQDHRLGLAIDTSDATALGRSIAAMIRRRPRHYFDPLSAGELVAARQPSQFAETIFAQLFDSPSALVEAGGATGTNGVVAAPIPAARTGGTSGLRHRDRRLSGRWSVAHER